MHESKATLEHPFGETTIKVGVSGNADRPNQVVTHMLSTAVTVTSIEIVQRGLSDSLRSDSTQREDYKAEVKFGDITVSAEISFELRRQESKRTLNGMVFSYILPKIWQTAGIYFGDNQDFTTPPAPLAQQPHRDVLDSIDDALALSTTPSRHLSEPYGPQLDEQQRRRQPAYR